MLGEQLHNCNLVKHRYTICLQHKDKGILLSALLKNTINPRPTDCEVDTLTATHRYSQRPTKNTIMYDVGKKEKAVINTKKRNTKYLHFWQFPVLSNIN